MARTLHLHISLTHSKVNTLFNYLFTLYLKLFFIARNKHLTLKSNLLKNIWPTRRSSSVKQSCGTMICSSYDGHSGGCGKRVLVVHMFGLNMSIILQPYPLSVKRIFSVVDHIHMNVAQNLLHEYYHMNVAWILLCEHYRPDVWRNFFAVNIIVRTFTEIV